jgi:predicted SnoaL-like aldol condensation-catalyzing enzyme
MLLLILLALALTSLLPVMAQDESPFVEYTFTGTELHRVENGVIVQVWTLTDTVETQQIAAILQAQAQSNDPTIRYTFDNDRMYELRGDQVVGLWLLRDGSWMKEPALVVRYEYDGHVAQRFVNDRLQETFNLIEGSYQTVAAMQAEANKIMAAHVAEELHVEYNIEHASQLLAENFALHFTPLGETPDMSWYSPEVADTFVSNLLADPAQPLVMAVDDLVLIHEPTSTLPPYDPYGIVAQTPFETPATFFDVYRLKDGKVTDLWSSIDLAALVQPN